MTTSTKPHPRLSSRLGALSLLTIALVFGASAVPAASTTPQNAAKSQAKVAYVALGDSFTSGQGAPPYRNGPCLQSKRASYPVITASLSNYTLVANQSCSGADTGDVITQVAQLPRGLKGDKSPVGLVTLTVGGIDAGSNAVLAACTPNRESDQCSGAILAAGAQLSLPEFQQNLGLSLFNTYVAAATAMPNAEVVVFNYPFLFDNDESMFVGAVNSATNTLNGIIAAAAASVRSAGHDVQVVDVTDEFSNKGISADPLDVEWISLDLTNLNAPANFHPNALGNSGGYYQALRGTGLLG